MPSSRVSIVDIKKIFKYKYINVNIYREDVKETPKWDNWVKVLSVISNGYFFALINSVF